MDTLTNQNDVKECTAACGLPQRPKPKGVAFGVKSSVVPEVIAMAVNNYHSVTIEFYYEDQDVFVLRFD